MSLRARAASPIWLAVLLAGCGSAQDRARNQQLESIAQAYHRFLAEKGHPPAALEDIAELLPEENKADTYQAIAGGSIIVRWRQDHRSREGARTVLAYPLAASRDGGPVLMLDRSIVSMTPQQLQEALR
jgi:hypothetical protein